MSRLSVHPEARAELLMFATRDRDLIGEQLSRRGIRFEQHPVAVAAAPAAPAQWLEMHAELVERQRREHGYRVVDVVSLSPDTPDLATLRSRFLAEHTHAEDEARFMTAGAGTFYLRHQGEVLMLELCAGDLISVPAGMRHWFDTGARPRFTAIRFFTRPDGWIAEFTGDPIAERFPLYAGAA